MIIRICRGKYNLVKSSDGKRIRVKGEKRDCSEATEFVDSPRDFEEVEEQPMKANKKLLGITVCLLLGLGVGTGVYLHYENQAQAILAHAEDVESEIISETEIISEEESITDESVIVEESDQEETSKLQDLLDELNAKYLEIRDTQLFGTTIGAIIGAVVGAVLSLAPSLLNKKNIQKAIEEVSLAKAIVDDNKKMAESLKTNFNITNENYEKAIKCVESISKELETAQALLTKVSQENAEIKAENEKLEDLLFTIFSQSKVLVALGISEETFKKYLANKNKKQEG